MIKPVVIGCGVVAQHQAVSFLNDLCDDYVFGWVLLGLNVTLVALRHVLMGVSARSGQWQRDAHAKGCDSQRSYRTTSVVVVGTSLIFLILTATGDSYGNTENQATAFAFLVLASLLMVMALAAWGIYDYFWLMNRAEELNGIRGVVLALGTWSLALQFTQTVNVFPL